MSSLDASQSFVWNLARVVEQHAGRTAIETANGQSLTYAQLWQLAHEMRMTLERNSVRRGDVVAICSPRSAEFVAGIIAAWLCEGVALPLDAQLPEARLAQVLAEAGPRFVVGKDLKVASGPGFDVSGYLIYTSGSSGQPKGVLLSHAGLVSVLKQQIDLFQITPESRCLWMHGTSFDASLSDIGTALLAGAALCFDEETPAALSLIERMAISHVDLPPSLLPYLDERTRLETIVIGGEICSAEIIRKWAVRTRVINVYGPTEATICTSMVVCDAQWSRPLIGQAINGIEYRVCDDHGRDVNTGELRIRGAAVALGYPWQPELSAQRFVEGGRTYRTGDLVTKHADGGLEFIGRLDRQFKLNGRLICPEEIERVLLDTKLVPRAVVMLVNCGTRSLLAACVESEAEIQTLRDALRARLPIWMVPSVWHGTKAMPSLSNGKPNVEAIRAILSQKGKVGAGSAFSADEEPIRQLFAESLQFDEFGPQDDFFTDLGGDSLAVVALMALAAERNLALSADAIHRGRSVAGVTRLMIANASEALPCCALMDDVNLHLSFATAEAEKPRCVLLTGATGFLGTALMTEIDCRVIPLSRSTGGDVRKEHFSWDAETWSKLADEVDTVVHLAAEVKLFAPYAELKASQVDGTRNVLRFCAEGRPKTLHYASSLSVFVDADPLETRCREDDLRRDVTNVHGGYAQSKWVAEQLVLRAREQGLRVGIHRLGLLSLNMQTGHGPRNDWLTLTLPGLIGAESNEDLAFDLTPVDHAARAMGWLIRGSKEGIFHIANPQPVTQSQIATLGRGNESAFAKLAGRRTHRSLDLFKCSQVRFDMQQTALALEDSGIVFPEITSDYLRRCVQHAESPIS